MFYLIAAILFSFLVGYLVCAVLASGSDRSYSAREFHRILAERDRTARGQQAEIEKLRRIHQRQAEIIRREREGKELKCSDLAPWMPAEKSQ